MKKIFFAIVALFLFLLPMQGFAADEKKEEKKTGIPNYVLNISKENTYPNPTQDLPQLQPSELAQQLLDSSDVKIDNPELIKLLNESTVNNSKLAIGFKASIYLGEWPLSYESSETNINWEYKKVNTNYIPN